METSGSSKIFACISIYEFHNELKTVVSIRYPNQLPQSHAIGHVNVLSCLPTIIFQNQPIHLQQSWPSNQQSIWTNWVAYTS